MKKKQPTMQDVANLAGVTQPTVSYVINNSANISQEVRQRVNQAIRDLNYKPNYFARSLKTNKGNIIGIVIPDVLNEYYAIVVHELERLLTQAGYSIVIHSTSYDAMEEKKGVHSLNDYNVEAIIFAYQPGTEESLRLLAEAGRPVIILEGKMDSRGLPCIHTDNYHGARTATQHLIGLGRSRIAYIGHGQSIGIEALQDRLRGFVDAMEEQGLNVSGHLFEASEPGNKWIEGVKLGKQLLEHSFDAVLVSSDVVAVGILRSLLTAGIRVPQDIAVIGYDDVPIAELFVPALTTVAQPIKEMCAMAVAQVLRGLGNGEMEGGYLKPRLILRETA